LFYKLIAVNGGARDEHSLNYGIGIKAEYAYASRNAESQQYQGNKAIVNSFDALDNLTDNV